MFCGYRATKTGEWEEQRLSLPGGLADEFSIHPTLQMHKDR